MLRLQTDLSDGSSGSGDVTLSKILRKRKKEPLSSEEEEAVRDLLPPAKRRRGMKKNIFNAKFKFTFGQRHSHWN